MVINTLLLCDQDPTFLTPLLPGYMSDLATPRHRHPWWHSLVPLFESPSGADSLPPRQTAGRSNSSPPTPGSPDAEIAVHDSKSWSPPSADIEWVQRVTHGGRAIATRRAEDLRSGKGPNLGIAPRRAKVKESRPQPAARAVTRTLPGNAY